MRLFSVSNWLKAPNDRDIITRWTIGGEKDSPDSASPSYTMTFATAGEEEEEWEFLAVGDTGDAEAAGPDDSPQDAVGREMAEDSVNPVGGGTAQMVIHTGDVIYMTGERRLYDRNFRRPYSRFLTQESTVDNLVFRLPFLPVPGNHDYYDLGAWANWLSRVPLLGRGLRTLAHRFFAFGIPEGGSDMGRAYMEAFVDLPKEKKAEQEATPLQYIAGKQTRIPNRYYQFRRGSVDFFALDSNTLDAPAPETVDPAEVRRGATDRIAALQKRADDIDTALRREQRARDEQQAALRRQIGLEPSRRKELEARADEVVQGLVGLRTALTAAGVRRLADQIQLVARNWTNGTADLRQVSSPEEAQTALQHLDDASDEACAALGSIEFVLADLEKGDPKRDDLIGRRDAVERSQTEWAKATGLNTDIDARIHSLTEEALDVQRDLAQEQRRQRYRPEDYDRAQLEWLDAALTVSEQERPDAWRIVYLHHPLYTTISNRCERPDVQGVRTNVLPVLQRHDIHVVFAGHSHAFEWLRSSALPNTGLFVTGGGGQISLRPSLFEPRRLPRLRRYYDSLRYAGVEECVMSGYGPSAADGERGLLYHYLRISVTKETITVRPVGVRRLTDRTYRREEPMPVFHAPYLPESRPQWQTHPLASVVVRRKAPPRAEWG
jgi:hypothetical protein